MARQLVRHTSPRHTAGRLARPAWFTRSMRIVRIVIATCVAGAALPARHASAHFGPAEPPDFGLPECIVVVDTRTTQTLHLEYDLAFDDVEPEAEKVMLPDSKTHEFFAFRGNVVTDLPRYQMRPFTGAEQMQLPLWINKDDWMRVDAANDPSIAPDFHGSNIGEDVLHVRPDLANTWLPVSTSPARVPITIEQAGRGVDWQLAGVAPGVYQIASYIFSPPYNAWEPRPGLIKIVDGKIDPPAASLESIDGMLYGGQGRHVRGCIDTPAGSTLSAQYTIEGAPERGWQTWLTGQPISTGKLDLCFQSPDPQLAGLVRVRVTVRAPDGSETTAATPDPVVLVATAAACTESETQCCMPTRNAQPAQPMQPATSASPVAGQAPIAGAMAAAGTAAPAMTPPPVVESGCAALARPAGGGLAAPWLLALALMLRRCRRRAARAPTADR